MKKTLQTNIAMNDSYDTRLCYTQCNVGLKCFFFNFTKMFVCYCHYFIDISQSSVDMHLWCGVMYNNHVIAN